MKLSPLFVFLMMIRKNHLSFFGPVASGIDLSFFLKKFGKNEFNIPTLLPARSGQPECHLRKRVMRSPTNWQTPSFNRQGGKESLLRYSYSKKK